MSNNSVIGALSSLSTACQARGGGGEEEEGVLAESGVERSKKTDLEVMGATLCGKVVVQKHR